MSPAIAAAVSATAFAGLRMCAGILDWMSAEDEEVLKFISRQGQTTGAISERFPDFDMLRLMRAGLVEERDIEPETQAHAHTSSQLIRHYTLTERGARAVGIDLRRLPTA
jgi:hypothetical protein